MQGEVVQPARVGESEDEADARAQALSEAICTAEIDLSDRNRVRIGSSLEQIFYRLAGTGADVAWLAASHDAVAAARSC